METLYQTSPTAGSTDKAYKNSSCSPIRISKSLATKPKKPIYFTKSVHNLSKDRSSANSSYQLSLSIKVGLNLRDLHSLDKMCEQDYRRYTCGHTKMEGFRQCDERAGTNTKCTPITKNRLPDSPHMCVDHMVAPRQG